MHIKPSGCNSGTELFSSSIGANFRRESRTGLLLRAPFKDSERAIFAERVSTVPGSCFKSLFCLGNSLQILPSLGPATSLGPACCSGVAVRSVASDGCSANISTKTPVLAGRGGRLQVFPIWIHTLGSLCHLFRVNAKKDWEKTKACLLACF
jgi:hypothetical protein